MTSGDLASIPPGRGVVLVGMMGAGKSAIGRRLAARLGLPFLDSDAEIEAAAGMPIARFVEQFGEPEFRAGERRVIARLLGGGPCVLSTGGGAFLDPDTRALIREKAISVWLKADIETLYTRATRRDDRPLLKSGDPREILAKLLKERAPVYAEADIAVESDDRPVDDTVDRVLKAIREKAEGELRA
jgi:shikimate kinase